MKNTRIVLLLGGAILIGSGAVWMFLGHGRDPKAPVRTLVAKKENVKKIRTREKPQKKTVRKAASVASVKVNRKPPAFEIGAEEEARLTEAQRKLLADIRAALQSEDRRAMLRFVRKIQSMNEWPDGIPEPIKKASLEALDWCGGVGCLPELLGFLADANPEIVRQAVSQWEDAIADCDHDIDLLNTDGSVREEGLATHVIAAARVVKDAEAMESILSEISSGMRHSVAVETIVKISELGNQVAIDQLASVIEALTDDASITTVEQLQEWLEKNPDDPDDGFMYGGEEDSSADDD